MGMFDKFIFPCKKCGFDRVEAQTKAGNCDFTVFTLDGHHPLWLVVSLDRTVHACLKCRENNYLEHHIENGKLRLKVV